MAQRWRSAFQNVLCAIWGLVVLLFVSHGLGESVSAAVADGVAAYKQGNFVLAYKLLQPEAERKAGDPEAQFYLGQLYERGQAIEKDLLMAYVMYSLAASSGKEEAFSRRDAMIPRLSKEDLVKAQKKASDIEGTITPQPPPVVSLPDGNLETHCSQLAQIIDRIANGKFPGIADYSKEIKEKDGVYANDVSLLIGVHKGIGLIRDFYKHKGKYTYALNVYFENAPLDQIRKNLHACKKGNTEDWKVETESDESYGFTFIRGKEQHHVSLSSSPVRIYVPALQRMIKGFYLEFAN